MRKEVGRITEMGLGARLPSLKAKGQGRWGWGTAGERGQKG